MERTVKGVTGAALSGATLGISVLIDLFYRATVLADPRWPRSVQQTAFLIALLVAIAVSVLCSGFANDRLIRYFRGMLGVTIGLLVLSYFLYLSIEVPFVTSRAEMIAIDAVWKTVDIGAMAFFVATVCFGSLKIGSSLWGMFGGGGGGGGGNAAPHNAGPNN
jgi:hypothetical protein